MARTGHSKFPVSSKSILLKDILHMLEVKKNVLSVYKVCKDNNVSFAFNKNIVYVKDRETYADHSSRQCKGWFIPIGPH